MLFVALLLAAAPDAGIASCAPCTVVPSPLAGFQRVLERKPAILAVGEYHEVNGAPKVPSAIRRFTRELLPALKGRLTSVVVETWMLNGKCGAAEKQATAAVEKTTQRPKTTEDEVTTLLDRTYEMGAKNHILMIDCDDHRSMIDDAGSLDAEASLLLVKRKVEAKALEVIEREEGGTAEKVLLLYGGAVHNDLQPLPEWRAYSFGPALAQETGGHTVELDLLVPEYVEADEDLVKEPWFAGAMALAKAGKTVLINPHPEVYLLLFPRTRGGSRN
ncbi:MAG: hypothetical protein Q8N23_17230 [Archangium sp.]|nr:hypothetical protein [Archangium sp.]MDP3572972.1 hypothetical protein [Archangium sp.]